MLDSYNLLLTIRWYEEQANGSWKAMSGEENVTAVNETDILPYKAKFVKSFLHAVSS